MKLLRIM